MSDTRGLMPGAEEANESLRRESPALWSALSDLGRRIAFPRDIPFQAGQARGKRFNATIGQITDGAGAPLPHAPIAAGLSGLGETARRRALLYSPVEGIPEVRSAWRTWQRREVDAGVVSSLPIATVGLTHGLSLVADLFGGPGPAGTGRPVVAPKPYWGNYRPTFAVRTGARMIEPEIYEDGRWTPEAIGAAIDAAGEQAGAGEAIVVIVNLPSNPGGYSPPPAERDRLLATLRSAAEARPLVVVCDDAYAGLVYEPGVPTRSIFWDLATGASDCPNLVPVKVDGATKELGFFGGRVGFLTFALPAEGEAAKAMESKVKCLTRAALGSPVAVSQVLIAEDLESGRAGEEFESVRSELASRWTALTEALGSLDPDRVRPLPSNAGCFSLLELADDLDADEIRRRLLDDHDTGVVSVGKRYLRIAFCSVARDDLPELVRRIDAAVRSV